MKLVRGIVREEKLYAIISALEDAGVPGLTVSGASGRGRHRRTGRFRGASYPLLLPMRTVEVLVTDDVAEDVARMMIGAARTGEAGDGHVFVLSLDACYAVRTGWLAT